MLILIRNLLCCQWGNKEGDWASKRIHCETVGVGDGSVCRDGNNSCWRLYGEAFGEKNSLQVFWNLIMDNMSFVSSYVISFLNGYRGVFVQILGWIIKLLKLPKKLYRNLKSLILGNVCFLWLLLSFLHVYLFGWLVKYSLNSE